MDSPRISSLSDVPEEVNISRSSSPYVHPAMSISTSGFKAHPSTSSLASLASASRSPSGPRNPIGLRSASTPTATKFSDTASIAGTSIAGVMTSSSTQKSRSKSPGSTTMRDRERDKERDGDKEKDGKDGKEGKSGQGSKGSRGLATQPRLRNTPHLPSGKDVEPVPATLMYWSRAPVYGLLPTHGMRAHSITLVDNIAWIFGGCDEKGCWRDVWCFSVESMQWSNPDTVGDIPPPCRAHTATLVDRRIVVFGGGEGPVYYSNLYVLDTITRRWQHPTFPEGTDLPPPRRAHTSVLYRGRIYVFGGGNGTQALNDLWTLEVGTNANVEKMRWEEQQTRGRKPSPRGYHTANLIGNVMIVMGGSDGRECFSDMWCLNLDNLNWSQVRLATSYRRLSHTATQVGSYLFICGGHDGSSYTSEMLLFNLVSLTFETRSPAGRSPSARGYHAALQADSRLFIFGGFNGNEVFDDVHLLDLAGAAYLPQVTSFRIEVD